MNGETVHTRRSEHLLEVIEERIATGLYLPGMRLDETELANEFEVHAPRFVRHFFNSPFPVLLTCGQDEGRLLPRFQRNACARCSR